MQKRNVLNSPRLQKLKKHRHRGVRNKILLCLLALVVIFSGCVYISRIPALNINTVDVNGNKVIETEAIKEIVRKETAGKYLWLFPKSSILLYPKNVIKKELYDNFKRLNSISLTIKNKNTLQVNVKERIASYTWCGLSLPAQNEISTEKKCYFMDESGYIFDDAPYFSGEVYFKFYGPSNINDPANPIGSFFSEQNFKKLILLKDALFSIGLKPIVLIVTDDGDIHILLSKGIGSVTEPEILLKADSDFEIVTENLQSALTTEPFQSDFKNKYSSLLYIDLRYGNKVYYKFQ